MRFKKNDKGSSIILVIVVLAIVGILAVVALWISLMNYQMKVTGQNVTDSFYSAEGVLDQICLGLQGDVSEAIDSAYNTVMQRYASESEDARTTTFANSYVNTLRNRLRYDKGNPVVGGITYEAEMLCDRSKLEGYISEAVLPQAKIYPAGDENAECFVLKTTTDGLIIKDLVVEYTDAKGNLSVIQTDIALSIPDMNLVSSEEIPDLFSYSIIGNGGVSITKPGTKIAGNVYAGSAHALDAAKVSASDYESLVVATGASVDFSGADYVIADGDISVSGKVAANVGENDTFVTDPFGQLWARNLKISGAYAGLLGTTYLSDDMTISGENAMVYFSAGTGTDQTLGNYYGYGTSTTKADQSSAIIINGTGAVLDLSGVGTMAIGGYAYIGTSKIASGSTTEIENISDIQMGESIAVKGDQIAYLVPAECIATEDGTSMLSQNPISVGDYESFRNLMNSRNQTNMYQLVDASVTIQKTGKKLSDYLGSKTISDAYTMIVVPSRTGNPKDGLVYFYLNLDADMATLYFQDYYSANSTKLTNYMGFYTQGIQALGEDAQIYTAGTYAQYTAEGASASYDIGDDPVNGGLGNCLDTYQALTTKLITTYSELSSDEIGKTVFSNLIVENETASGAGDGLKKFLEDCPGRKFETWIETANGGRMTLVLVDNAGKDAYVHSDGNAKNSYLIIATGDVNVEANFAGTIIAGGKVTVQSSANITIEPAKTEYIKQLLAQECTNGSSTLYAYLFFKDGNIYMISGFTGSSQNTVTGDSSQVNLGDLITYQNWKKK